MNVPDAYRARLVELLCAKNEHELRKAALHAGLDAAGADALCGLLTLHGPFGATLTAAKATAATAESTKATAKAKQAATDADAATAKAKTATAESIDATDASKTATTYANTAGQQAATAAERLEATRAEMELAIARAEQVVQGVPNGLKVEAPDTVTLGNPVRQYIKPKVKPDGCAQNVIYQTDGQSVEIEPDGEIQARETGTTRVHVIPAQGTKYYKTIRIEVVPPRIRLTSGGIRLDKDGNIRLT